MIAIRRLADHGITRAEPFDRATLDAVRKIVEDVRTRGDDAVRQYTKKFDKVTFKDLEVSPDEMAAAEQSVGQKEQAAIRSMHDTVGRYHRQSVPKPFEFQPVRGMSLGRLVVPFEVAGLYVPGGRATYPSSVIMGAVPAAAAGVKRIVLCTPPGPEGGVPPSVLFAARVSGVERVFKIGGAQAIAAMAFGTKSVPRVDIIAGPGNRFVTAAKSVVAGHVPIDFLAGPTEILIVSDGEGNAKYIAADLIAQAEHDPAAVAILVTTSRPQAEAVAAELAGQVPGHARADIIREALIRHGAILVADGLDEAMAFANELAPEHLVISCRQGIQMLHKVRNAGAVFVGDMSPVASGDYGAGPNAILPTQGAAKRSGGLSASTFLKCISYEMLSREGLESIAPMAMTLARLEGLGAHQRSIEVRLGR